MKRKTYKIMAFLMCLIMCLTNITPTMAASTIINSIGSINQEDDGANVGIDKTQTQQTMYSEDIEEEGSQNTNVYVSQASTFGVFIPKTIVLAGEKDENGLNTADYVVSVSSFSNINGTETINVVPEESFEMTSYGKNPIVANVTQDKVAWKYNELDVKANGVVSTNDMTAGMWNGFFKFNISLEDYVPKTSGLSLSEDEVIIGIDGNKQVNAYVDGELANDSVTWESDNENIIVTNGLVETKASAKVGDVAIVTVKVDTPSTQVAKNDLANMFSLTKDVMASVNNEIQFTVTIIDIEYEIEYLDIMPGNEANVTAKILPEGTQGVVSWSSTAIAGMNLVKDGNNLTIKIANDMETGKTYNIVATFGDYSKVLPINIINDSQTIQLEAGLYDANDVMLCSWEDSGIDVETNYTSSNAKTTTTSPYYVLTNNYPTTTKVIIPNSITNIGDWAFYNCTNLTNIELSNNTTNISNYAFYNCTNLTNIEIPESVTNIGNNAFYNCKTMTNVDIPKNVTNIGTGAFEYCNGLANINVDENNTSYCSKEGVLFTKNMDTLIKYPSSKKETSYVIPNNVITIEEEAFYYCYNLLDLEISNGVKYIGTSAFEHCKNITNIEIPNSVTNLGDRAFNFCSNLNKVILSSSLTTIEPNMFAYCTSLISVGEIGSGASVEIPNNVTEIEMYAFINCTNLTNVVLPNNLQTIGCQVFENCTNITNIEIPDSVTYIDRGAFHNCTKLSSIYIPKTTTTINAYSYSTSPFYECSSTLKIYCGASSKQSKWGTYWNYYGSGKTLTTKYNVSRTTYNSYYK